MHILLVFGSIANINIGSIKHSLLQSLAKSTSAQSVCMVAMLVKYGYLAILN